MKFNLNTGRSYSFLKSVKNTIVSNRMFCVGDRVLVAVSGGPDSIALLHALVFFSQELNISIGIAHLNHNLRGDDSQRDALFVESEAKNLNIPFYSVTADVLKVKCGLKLSIEASARKVRYAFFRKIMFKHSFSKVALGHHKDDNAELILMFMLRGSGLAGLSGMLPVRENCYVRPFIGISKFQIIKYLSDENIKYIEDESNSDLRFTRNKIRHCLIPFITSKFNSKIVKNLNHTGTIVASENEWIEQTVSIEYDKAILFATSNEICLSVPILKNLHIAVVRRIIRKTLMQLLGSLKGISFTHVEAALELIKNTLGYKCVHLPNYIHIDKYYDILKIKIVKKESCDKVKETKESIVGFSISDKFVFPLVLQDANYRFKFSIIDSSKLPSWHNINKNNGFFDLNFLKFPLSVRYAVPNDTINPLGMRGRQKLKKYFINKKIPLSERSRTLVIDDDGKIAWLVMHVVCDYAKVISVTRDVLMIEFCLLKAQ